MDEYDHILGQEATLSLVFLESALFRVVRAVQHSVRVVILWLEGMLR